MKSINNIHGNGIINEKIHQNNEIEFHWYRDFITDLLLSNKCVFMRVPGQTQESQTSEWTKAGVLKIIN